MQKKLEGNKEKIMGCFKKKKKKKKQQLPKKKLFFFFFFFVARAHVLLLINPSLDNNQKRKEKKKNKGRGGKQEEGMQYFEDLSEPVAIPFFFRSFFPPCFDINSLLELTEEHGN
eukprot:TRINITY_DN2599_c5_g1_i1.p2 TRINITY_DN2599_c5_g1~~TRINITY_DN2599_c5_g1_i1.p2  ORF type:complete len:115 (-),score=11.65 TRINITY_DN2599_c5_g1_i1:49-393(-)